MQANIINIVYSSSVSQLTEVNSSFDRGVIRVAYHGKNRNGSYISKEAFERSLPTIYNCPVVCNYNREIDMIGSHDVEIVKTAQGMQLVNLTHPIGVVPANAAYGWEFVEEDNGEIHEYLWVEALLWKRQEAYKKVKENLITDESMEITVKNGKTIDGCLHIDSFEFTAFCLLESAEPCFESAQLEMFSVDEFREQYAEMMADLKNQFTDVNASLEAGINSQNTTKNLSKGGNSQLNKTLLLEKYGLSADELDFDIEAITEEELYEAVKSKSKTNGEDDDDTPTTDDSDNDTGSEEENPDDQNPDYPEPDDGTGDNTDDETPDTGTGDEGSEEGSFSLTACQLQEQIIDSLCSEVVVDPQWGEIPRYCYYDHDTEASEVYCYDVCDWKLYGFKYEMNGDNVSVDFDSKTKKKISIVDFDEGDQDLGIQYAMDNLKKVIVASKDLEISGMKDTIVTMEAQLSELKEYRLEKESAARQEALDALFAQFKELDGVEAFETLKAECNDMELSEIENKCYELKGRNFTAAFSVAKPKSTRLPVEEHQFENEPYGGLFVKFPPAAR